MAGIMNKLNGYLYQGEMTNGTAAAVENGMILTPGTSTNSGKLVLLSTADATSLLTCIEVTELYGVTAYRFRVDKLAATYYFVENQIDVNSSDEFDYATYTTAADALLRAHPLSVGEEFTTTAVTGTIAVNTAYGIGTDGKIKGAS